MSDWKMITEATRWDVWARSARQGTVSVGEVRYRDDGAGFEAYCSGWLYRCACDAGDQVGGQYKTRAGAVAALRRHLTECGRLVKEFRQGKSLCHE